MLNSAVAVFCVLGIAAGALVIAFSVRNYLRKSSRLFSAMYAAVSGLVLFVLIRMLNNVLNGFICARDPAGTLLIYAGIDALLLFFLRDAVISGKNRKSGSG